MRAKHFVILFFTLFTALQNLSAQTVCALTFNSSDEREVFRRQLTPIGAHIVELVPDNKDPQWFQKSCATAPRCDVVIFSGHFGGLFFGEQSSLTLSLKEMKAAKASGSCRNILEAPKSVFLMGCNTLATKTPDHRSVSDYLNVLVGDGFPLSLAEEVAAARYLNFGTSMQEKMQGLFSGADYIAGFESTGPLGRQAAPLLERAFKNTSSSEKRTRGLNPQALKNAFGHTSMRVVGHKPDDLGWWQETALLPYSPHQNRAWEILLREDLLPLSFDFFIGKRDHPELREALSFSPARERVYERMNRIFNESKGLSSIQVGIADFLMAQGMITQPHHQQLIAKTLSELTSGGIDYIRAGQICEVLKANPSLALAQSVRSKILASSYSDVLFRCGKSTMLTSHSRAYQCLVNGHNHDWGCLTENPDNLDVASCLLAKSRNQNAENADDMLWYCYSKMHDYGKLTRPSCLELTNAFNLLGNRIKMNWNCLNRI